MTHRNNAYNIGEKQLKAVGEEAVSSTDRLEELLQL